MKPSTRRFLVVSICAALFVAGLVGPVCHRVWHMRDQYGTSIAMMAEKEACAVNLVQNPRAIARWERVLLCPKP